MGQQSLPTDIGRGQSIKLGEAQDKAESGMPELHSLPIPNTLAALHSDEPRS
jgi:hypothetical protein